MTDDVATKIEKFFAGYRSRKYEKGQILILSGDPADFVYHLKSGRVKQYDVTYRGEEVVLNIFKPPAFFPMALAINKTPNNYIYEAETDIEIQQAPADEVVRFIKDNPDVTFDLLSRVYRGVDGLLSRMVYLMASSANKRLILELLIEAKRFGETLPNGGTKISISEKDLGTHAGLSRETVSREISKLKNDGLIERNKNGIVIANLINLEAKLGKEI